ncbi:MAG: hypothetical protein NC343_04165 [Muribaculum sp.]|nr:hypothetical protein [Muribaculaceae bacterium]MCM1080925.1 hypothetical protein [Muribaculum sp.]
MNQIILLLTTVLAAFTTSNAIAQELRLVESRQAMEPMTVPMQRLDANNEICALVKVVLPKRDVQFEGNIVGEPIFKTNEYWVYVTPGTKMLNIKVPDHYPLMVNFVEAGLGPLTSKSIYYLVIKSDQPQASSTDQDSQTHHSTTVIEGNTEIVLCDKWDFNVIDLIEKFPAGRIEIKRGQPQDITMDMAEKLGLNIQKYEITPGQSIGKFSFNGRAIVNNAVCGHLDALFSQNHINSVSYSFSESKKQFEGLVNLIKGHASYESVSKNFAQEKLNVSNLNQSKFFYNKSKNILVGYSTDNVCFLTVHYL